VHFAKSELHAQSTSFVEMEKTPTNSTLKIPHMGWNTVKQTQEHPLWHNSYEHYPYHNQ
jgi:imidazoleglycerol phosphate synthase glutamine amidotransferase subunit HisH